MHENFFHIFIGGHAIIMSPFSLILGQFRVIKAVKTAVQLNKDEEEERKGEASKSENHPT